MKTQRWLSGWAGCLLLGLTILVGCSPELKPVATAHTEPGANAVDEGPDETTLALEEKLSAKKKTASKSAKALAKKSSPPPAPARQPGTDEQWCFGCDGKGNVGCGGLGCRNGWVDCPGPCVTRNEGTWVKDPKPGAPAGSVAFVLRFPGVKSTWYVSEFHAGEVWQLQNGQLISAGYCPTCNGSRTLRCPTCQGSGVRSCPVCDGKTVLLTSWKPTDNPWFNRQPDAVRLKDGRAFLGRDAGGDELIVMFRTQAGETLSVPRGDVVQWPKSK